MKSVYSYRNYRKIILDYYKWSKKNTENFTFDVFAERAGYKSNSSLIQVINGKKTIGRHGAISCANAMDLDFNEMRYFEALSQLNDSTTKLERDYFKQKFQKISGQRIGHQTVNKIPQKTLKSQYADLVADFAKTANSIKRGAIKQKAKLFKIFKEDHFPRKKATPKSYKSLVIAYKKSKESTKRGNIKFKAKKYKEFSNGDFPWKNGPKQPAICMVPSCRNNTIAKRMCWKHYTQYQKGKRSENGRPLLKIRENEKNKGTICTFSSCKREAISKGFCISHYGWLRSGVINSEGAVIRTLKYKNIGKICKVKNCNYKAKGKEFCSTHLVLYKQGFITLEGKFEKVKIKKANQCKVKGCEVGKISRGFCHRHYCHFRSGIIDAAGNQLRELLRNKS